MKHTSENQDPKIWGPKFWYSLHAGSLGYPENPSETYKNRMRWFIMGIPVMLPCDTCKDHANAYILSHSTEIDNAVLSKDNLFKFFVDFHNAVNYRQRKRVISYEEAYFIYS